MILISNLLPLSGYDGYNVINDSISLFYGHENAGKTMPKITLGTQIPGDYITVGFTFQVLNWQFFNYFVTQLPEARQLR